MSSNTQPSTFETTQSTQSTTVVPTTARRGRLGRAYDNVSNNRWTYLKSGLVLASVGAALWYGLRFFRSRRGAATSAVVSGSA